ncbi:SIS domain-containing protein [Herbiconiux moechotypicola]|uniref:SIS domain-containing protein n=1 Tax=Herbiconiux moechotypicola TaxID=637393 RepID=A0ABP5QKW6_9MICO|nr:SIS domain-containing protein [Herbiconiux moechotypicola]MCS5731675.1 SIS domain-containing protein [Herbiconiux moechotypicola]
MASLPPHASVDQQARAVLRVESAAIAALADRMDWSAVESLVDLLLEPGGRVFTSGCGTSGAAAKKIAHTLSCVGCSASFLNPSDAPHGALGAVRRGDVVILISKGGGTEELVRLLPALASLGVRIVAITGVPDSVIGRKAEITLRVEVDAEPDPFNMLATASTLAVTAVMDAVTICVMQRNGFDRRQFGVIHPGGAVGERLAAHS